MVLKCSPFDLPPSEYHQGILKAVEPFLRIHKRPIAVLDVSDDRFRGNLIPSAALYACQDFITPELAEKERSFWGRNSQPLHLEMIRLVESFTKPTDVELELLKKHSVPSCTDDEDQSGFVLVPGVNRFSSDDEEEDPAEDEGFEMDSENGQGENDISGRGRTDYRVLVHDYSRRPSLSSSLSSEIPTQRCALVADFKEEEEEDAIYQASAYSRDDILRNISNKHYKPVYLLVFSKAKFTYGMIKYEGSICASGNAITEAAYTDFCCSCKDPAKCTSQDSLAARFKAGTQYLRSVYKPGVNYPKRSYIVGDLYMAQHWFPLPTTATTGGMVSYGANRLFEGLLLTLVGDVVRKWSENDVINAYTRRKIQSYAATCIAGRSSHNVRDALFKQQRTFKMCAGAFGMEYQESGEEDEREEAKRRRNC